VSRPRLAVLLGATLLAGTLPAADDPSPAAASGHLLLIGGGERPAVVLARFVELAGGPDARILVLPTASELPDIGEVYARELAERGGARAVEELPLRSRADASRPELVARIAAADGLFFTGGDQSRITAALAGTPAGEAVTAAFRRGAAIGGSSAGTACMSPWMLTGEGDFESVRPGGVELVPGLGLADGTILDQHFLVRGRFNRLLAAVLEHPDLVGVGVDEATAVWIRPDQSFEVIGERQVLVVDARGTAPRRADAGAGDRFGADGVRLHLLLPGDRFDLAAGRRMP
jgi:cyanophycinase